MTTSLTIRLTTDGPRIQGDLPENHTFAASWVDRNVGDFVEVNVVINTTDGPVVYKLAGFEKDGEKPNYTAWQCELVDQA